MGIDVSARISATTINKYIKQETIPLMRRRKLLAALKEKGRITFNNSGPAVTWPVRYRRPLIVTNDDMQITSGQRTNMWKQATLPWRSLRGVEVTSKMEQLTNKGPEAIVKVLEKIVPAQTEAIGEVLANDMYNDGNSASADYGERIHGFESWCGNTGYEVYDNSGGTGTWCADPSDTYAGLSTALAAYGSPTWTAGTGLEWPVGVGDPEYSFFSPLLVDYENTNWKASTKTWPNTWQECLRFGMTYMESLQNRSPDLFLLNAELYRQALDSLNSITQLNVQRADRSIMTKLGFETVSFEGVDLTYEYGVPAGVGYGICYDALELMSLQSQLFAYDEDAEFSNQTREFSVDFYGNLKIQTPAWFIKFVTGITER